jgi:hypothetical protein
MVPGLRLTTTMSEVRIYIRTLSLTVREPMSVGAVVVRADRLALDSMWVAPTFKIPSIVTHTHNYIYILQSVAKPYCTGEPRSRKANINSW